MKKLVFCALLAAGLFLSQSAFAVPSIDLAKTTCDQLMQMNDDEAASVLIWIDGYQSAKDRNAVVGGAHALQMMGLIAGYCAGHPNTAVIDVVKALTSK